MKNEGEGPSKEKKKRIKKERCRVESMRGNEWECDREFRGLDRK